jgi:hypothetical protein
MSYDNTALSEVEDLIQQLLCQVYEAEHQNGHPPLLTQDLEQIPPTALAQAESSPNKILLKDIKYDPNAIPIWQLAARISAKVPDEEWARVPPDLSQRFDYYQELRDNS